MERFTVSRHLIAALLFILCNVIIVQAQGGPSTGPGSDNLGTGSIVPATANTSDIGSAVNTYADVYANNIRADVVNTTGLATLNSTTVNGTCNVIGTTTLNAMVGNSTLNTTGLATLDNCTVNGTMTAVDAVLSGVANVTGLTTLNGLVGNSTVNVTGLLTANNLTVNSTKTATLSGPVVLGMNSITTDTNITATCSTICRITDIPNGTNIRITFTPGAAGTVAYIVDESGSLGNSTNGGNVTCNVTGGTINGLDNVTLTNATQVGGFYDPTTGTNVSCFKLHFPTTTSGFVYK